MTLIFLSKNQAAPVESMPSWHMLCQQTPDLRTGCNTKMALGNFASVLGRPGIPSRGDTFPHWSLNILAFGLTRPSLLPEGDLIITGSSLPGTNAEEISPKETAEISGRVLKFACTKRRGTSKSPGVS
jgi:hypothetical protein